MTVVPAKTTERPEVAREIAAAVTRIAPFGHSLAVAGHDEERIVDAHPEADHGHDLGGERRSGDHMREQIEDGEGHGNPEEGGDDRQPHGHDGAEGQQHDDDGGQDADSLVRPR